MSRDVDNGSREWADREVKRLRRENRRMRAWLRSWNNNRRARRGEPLLFVPHADILDALTGKYPPRKGKTG